MIISPVWFVFAAETAGLCALLPLVRLYGIAKDCASDMVSDYTLAYCDCDWEVRVCYSTEHLLSCEHIDHS